jgi:serine protease Do
MIVTLLFASATLFAAEAESESGPTAAARRVVKLYGAGGVGRIEGYGSGVLVSGDGLILTVDSPLLSGNEARVVLADGSRCKARIVGMDRSLDLAALQIEGDRPSEPLEHFDLSQTVPASAGDPVWAASNLFGIAVGEEAVSLQRGIVSARTSIASRQGIEDVRLPGGVYVLDLVTNNPGAAGGALVDARGGLVGILAKELRNQQTQTWISLAVPAEGTRSFLDKVRAGQAETRRPRPSRPDVDRRALARVDLRGMQLVPEVLERTPPFVDNVEPHSPAQEAGLLPDDLIVYLGEVIIPSTNELREVLAAHPAQEPIKVVVMREGELVSLELSPRDSSREDSSAEDVDEP